MRPELDTPAKRRRKLFMLCDEHGFTKDERLELAKAILWRDVVSFSQLSDAQVSRLLDAFEGYEKILWTIAMRVDA